MFMIKVMNNDFDGFESFRLAQLKYVGKIEKKEDKRTSAQDERAKIQQSFCENSSSALIVLSTNPSTFDMIVHANEEVEVVFGYKRKDILDQHISILIPQVIGRHHDNFINKYLNKSRLTFNDRIMSNFAQTKDGMLAPIDILIKIYPRINGDIKLVGIIRRTELNIQGSLSTHSWVESMTQYILTDRYGSITNITQGLIEMLGLHPKFFQHKRVNTLLNIKMDMIAHEALEPKNQEAMQIEGMGLQFDTRNLLSQIDNELITPTEADILRPHLKRVEIFTRIKRLHLSENDYCQIYILSVVKEAAQNFLRTSNSDDRSEDIHHIARHSLGSSPSSKHENDQAELNSVSSQQSQYDSFSNIVRDFKKTLTQRQMPMALTNLNRMLIFIALTTLILLILLDSQAKNEAAKVFHLKQVLLAVDTRNLYLPQQIRWSQTSSHSPPQISLTPNLTRFKTSST
ncbi:hypothetical protein FGO68_gene11593 [Halteria grandinella]|uniref:PAS domain-containing protein n=1 Tax=Halteria grandinella TaxID=5974 RepID=A0A8J8TAW8_HALGN|nr:hypothetical protein FGO68_gene11593 [Halteria grandinella]